MKYHEVSNKDCELRSFLRTFKSSYGGLAVWRMILVNCKNLCQFAEKNTIFMSIRGLGALKFAIKVTVLIIAGSYDCEKF